MAVSNMNSRKSAGNVTVFQYGITGLSESTSLIQSKAKNLHDSGELLNMVQELGESAAETYVAKDRYLEDRSKIGGVGYTLGDDGWYYKLNYARDGWIRVRYGENPGIDEIYRAGWRRAGAFCMSWPSLSKNRGIPDRLDVSITGDMSAYERFLDVVEREPRPCEVRIGGIESTNFPDKFVKTDYMRFDSVNAIMPDFKLQYGDRINIKFRPRYPMQNLTPEGTTLDTTILNSEPNPEEAYPWTVTVEDIGGWKENTSGVTDWNGTNMSYPGYRAFESYSNTGVASSTATMTIKVVNNTKSSRYFYFYLAPYCQTASTDYTYYQYSYDGTNWTGSATSSTYKGNSTSWRSRSRSISAGAAMWFRFTYVKDATTDTAPDKGGVFIQDTYNNTPMRSIYIPGLTSSYTIGSSFQEKDSFSYEDVTVATLGDGTFADIDSAYEILTYIAIDMNNEYDYWATSQRIAISDLIPNDEKWRFCGEFEIPNVWGSSNWQSLFRSYTGEDYTSYRIIRSNGAADKLLVSANSKASGGSTVLSNTFSTNTRYRFELRPGSCIVDGTSTSISTTAGTPLTGPIWFESGKWYWFDAYYDGTLVKSLRPCRRKSDNMVGFIDLISKAVYFPGSVQHPSGSVKVAIGCINYSDLRSKYSATIANAFGTNSNVAGGWERVSPNDLGFTSVYTGDEGRTYFRSDIITGNKMSAMMLMFHTSTAQTFTLHLRNFSESNFDYAVVMKVDDPISNLSWQPSSNSVLYTNKGKSDESQYYDVNISIPAGSHFVWIVYGKDGSVDDDDDRAYIQIDHPCIDSSIDGSSLSSTTHREYSISWLAYPAPMMPVTSGTSNTMKHQAEGGTSGLMANTWNGYGGMFTARNGLDPDKIYYASAWIRINPTYPDNVGYGVITVIDDNHDIVAIKAWKAGPEYRRVWIGFTGVSNVVICYSHRSYPGIYEPNATSGGKMVSAAYGYWDTSSNPPSANDYVDFSGLALQQADDVDPMTCPAWHNDETQPYPEYMFVTPLFMTSGSRYEYSNNLEDMPPVYYEANGINAYKNMLMFKMHEDSSTTFDMYWIPAVSPANWTYTNSSYVYKGTAVMKDGWLYAGLYFGSSSDYDRIYDLNNNTAYPVENCATVSSSYIGYFQNNLNVGIMPYKFAFGSGMGGGTSSGAVYYAHCVPTDIAYVSVTRNDHEIRKWMPARWNISDIGVAAQNCGCRVDDSGYCIASGERALRHHKSEGMWEYVRNTFEDVNISRTSVYVETGDSSYPTGTIFTPRIEDPAATPTKEAKVDRYARHTVDVNDNENFHWLWRNNLGWVDPDTIESVIEKWAYVDSSMGELYSGLSWSDSLPGSRTTTGFPTSNTGTGTGVDFYLYRPTVTWKSGTPVVTTEDPGVLCGADYFDFPLEWAGVNNAAYLDTGVTVSSRHRIKIKFQCAASANSLPSVYGSILRCEYPGHRVAFFADLENTRYNNAGFYCEEGMPTLRVAHYGLGGLHDPHNWEFGNGYIKDLDTGKYVKVDYRDDASILSDIMPSLYGFPATGQPYSTAKTACIEPGAAWSSSDYTWTIGKGFNTAGTNNGLVRIWYVIIEDEDGTVLFDARPYFHYTANKVYFVDTVSKHRIAGMNITKYATDENDTAAQASAKKLVPSHSRTTRYFWDTYNTSSDCGVTASPAVSAMSAFSTCHWFEWLQMVALPNMYIGGYENKETDRNEIWIHPGAYAGEECPPGMIPMFANEDDSGEIVPAGKFKLVSRYKSTAAHHTTADWDPSIFPNLDTARGREWLRRGVTSASGLSLYNKTFNNSTNTGMCGIDFALQNTHVYGLTGWEHSCLGFIECAYLRTMYVYFDYPGFMYQDWRFNTQDLIQRRPTGLADPYATRPGVTGMSGKAYPFGTGMGQGPRIPKSGAFTSSQRSYTHMSDKFGYNRERSFMWMENFGSDKGISAQGDCYLNNFIQYNDSNGHDYDPDTSIIFIRGHYGNQVDAGYDILTNSGWSGDRAFNSAWGGYGFFNTAGAPSKLRIYVNPDNTPTGVHRSEADPSRKTIRTQRFLVFGANKANQTSYTSQTLSANNWIPDMINNGTYDRIIPKDVQIFYATTSSYNMWIGVNIWGGCMNSGGWGNQTTFTVKNMGEDGKFDPIIPYTGFGIDWNVGTQSGTVSDWRFALYGGWGAYTMNTYAFPGANPFMIGGNYYNAGNPNATTMVTCDVTGI